MGPCWPGRIGEVGHEDGVFLELREDVLDGEFIIPRHHDRFDLRLLEELLLADEDILEEVLVDASLIGQVKLHWKGISKKEN